MKKEIQSEVIATFFLFVICGLILLFVFQRPMVEFRKKTSIPINPETARKIKIGMTRLDVDYLLGKPPGDYSSRPVEVIDVGNTISGYRGTLLWIGDDFAIAVRFNESGTVDTSRCCQVYPMPPEQK
jgi:hypothetical protein